MEKRVDQEDETEKESSLQNYILYHGTSDHYICSVISFYEQNDYRKYSCQYDREHENDR